MQIRVFGKGWNIEAFFTYRTVAGVDCDLFDYNKPERSIRHKVASLTWYYEKDWMSAYIQDGGVL